MCHCRVTSSTSIRERFRSRNRSGDIPKMVTTPLDSIDGGSSGAVVSTSPGPGPKSSDSLKSQSSNFDFDRISASVLRKSLCRIMGGILMLCLVAVPALLPNILLQKVKAPNQFVYLQESGHMGNSTRIIEVCLLALLFLIEILWSPNV